MIRICALVLLLAAAAFAQERTAVRFRLKKAPGEVRRGWMLEYDEAGFRFESFGVGTKVSIRWEELVDEDARRLRQERKLELTEDERLGLIDGHELFFKGGGSVRGLLDRHDIKGERYWFRSGGLILPYPEARVEHIDEIKIKESEVYTEEEVYIRRLERVPPRSAIEHRVLADYMFDIGNWEKADEHYRQAIEDDESLRPQLEGRLAEIKDYIEDKNAGEIFRQAKSLANLRGDYTAAILAVELYIEAHPGAKRRGLRIIDAIQVRHREKLESLFHRAKHEAFDRSVDRYLATRKPDIQQAMSWSTTQLAKDIERRLRQRMNLSPEEYELFKESKAKGAPHFATYWSGTFVISKRAARGKSSKRAIRGDPDSWWDTYNDTRTRSTWLKAYAAERLPDLFEIVQVRTAPCEKCGGKGVVKHMSLRGLESLNGGHEWFEKCPRCFGAQEDRAVAYR